MSFRKANVSQYCVLHYFTLPFSLAILLLEMYSKETARHRPRYLHKELVLPIVVVV